MSRIQSDVENLSSSSQMKPQINNLAQFLSSSVALPAELVCQKFMVAPTLSVLDEPYIYGLDHQNPTFFSLNVLK